MKEGDFTHQNLRGERDKLPTDPSSREMRIRKCVAPDLQLYDYARREYPVTREDHYKK